MHKHTLWYPKRGSRGRPVCFQSHILTQCSLSPGNFERGARGRLVCLGVVYPLVNNPRGRLVRLHLVCPLVTSRGVPGEGLFVLNHTHTPVDEEGRVELGSIVGGGKEFSVGVSPSPPHLPSHFSHTLTFPSSPPIPLLPRPHLHPPLTPHPHTSSPPTNLTDYTKTDESSPIALYPGC